MNKKFTKILLLLFVISIALPSVAQKSSTSKHELRVSIGMLNILPDADFGNSRNQGHLYEDGNYYYTPYSNNFSNQHYDQLLYHYGPDTSTGTISVGYSYNILRWLSLGATFSYAGVFHQKFERGTDKVVEKENNHNFSLTPMIRFTYLNRPIIRLYSQGALGLAMNKTVRENNGNNYSYNNWTASGQITFFGIAVGRNLFGFAELGAGFQGVFVMGIGYKFNDKKN